MTQTEHTSNLPPHCGHRWYRGVLDADAEMPPDIHTCTRWQAGHAGAHRCCCGDTKEAS